VALALFVSLDNDFVSMWQGYRVIFSNYDAWYLDCGYGGWVAAGNNWCSPYKGWQLAYDNSPRQIYRCVLSCVFHLSPTLQSGEFRNFAVNNI
jgi:hypothetical protein